MKQSARCHRRVTFASDSKKKLRSGSKEVKKRSSDLSLSQDVSVPLSILKKHDTVRRIVHQYVQLESECCHLRGSLMESGQKYELMRERHREQRLKANTKIVECVLRLHHAEDCIQQLRSQYTSQLALLERELLLLHSGMSRERVTLTQMLDAKDDYIAKLEHKLGQMEDKLIKECDKEKFSDITQVDVDHTSFKEMERSDEDEEDEEDVSLFLPKFVIRPSLSSPSSSSMDDVALPPPLPPPVNRRRRPRPPTRGHDTDDAFLVPDSGRDTDHHNEDNEKDEFSDFLVEQGLSQCSLSTTVSTPSTLVNHRSVQKVSQVKRQVKLRQRPKSDLKQESREQSTGSRDP